MTIPPRNKSDSYRYRDAFLEGYEAQVRPRSGVTSRTKLRVQLGTIDNSYTGDIGIIIDNTHSGRYSGGAVRRTHFTVGGDISRSTLGTQKTYGSYDIRKGDKLAQLVIQELPQVEAFEIEKLPDTERGSNGFGSSGY